MVLKCMMMLDWIIRCLKRDFQRCSNAIPKLDELLLSSSSNRLNLIEQVVLIVWYDILLQFEWRQKYGSWSWWLRWVKFQLPPRGNRSLQQYHLRGEWQKSIQLLLAGNILLDPLRGIVLHQSSLEYHLF